LPATTDGLVLFWNMETLTGGLMDDLSTTGNNGTITGAADIFGAVSRARRFLGSNPTPDRIVADSAPVTGASFTITAWLKRVGGTSSIIQILMAANQENFIAYRAGTTRFGFDMRSGGAGSSVSLSNSSVDAAASYVFVAATYNGHTARLFRNAVSQASAAQTGTFTWNSFRVRADAVDTGDGGDCDELRVYSRALNGSEILSIYNDLQNYPANDIRDWRGVRVGVGRRMTKGEV